MPPKICTSMPSNNNFKYFCEKCDYGCNKLFLYNQHLKTKKHEKQKCSQVSVFVRTSPFSDHKPQHTGYKTIELATPTNDTRDILIAAKKALLPIFRSGYDYAKAGILLSRFTNETSKQYSLFKDPNEPKENSKFMEYIDQLNAYETQVYFASQNTKRWSPMKQNMTSPKYTTCWYELPTAN